VKGFLTITTAAAVTLAMAAAGSAQGPQLGPVKQAAPARITLDDFKKALDEKSVIVLDVRAAEAYANGHIPGSLSRPLGTIDGWAAELKGTKKPIVTYCA